MLIYLRLNSSNIFDRSALQISTHNLLNVIPGLSPSLFFVKWFIAIGINYTYFPVIKLGNGSFNGTIIDKQGDFSIAMFNYRRALK